MRIRITTNLKNAILREAKKNPHLGVRGLAKILKEKHKTNISKSAIDNVLRAKGFHGKQGRKKHLLLYLNKSGIDDCGLLMLRAMDSQVGLYDLLKKELKAYFPGIEPVLLKKILILLSLSAYIGTGAETAAKRKGFLRIADSYIYPAKRVKYLLKRTVDYKPAISLREIKDNARLVSTLKFHFLNGSVGFCDAKLTTPWDGYCHIRDFFLPLYQAKQRIAEMIKEKMIIINYTKSFDYLSPLLLDFINGLSKGVKSVDFLTEKGQVLDKMTCDLEKPTYLIGYYPKILAKGFMFLEKEKRFKKMDSLEGVVWYTPMLTRFSQPKLKEAIILNNILIKTKEKYLPTWAVLTDKKTNLKDCLKKYLFLWPHMEKALLSDMKLIENFFLNQEEKKDFVKELPDALLFEKEADYGKIADILALFFKNEFTDAGLKGCKGTFVIGKDFCRLSIAGLSSEIKRKINNTCLYINDKRLFLV